jgi:hypothetical protein
MNLPQTRPILKLQGEVGFHIFDIWIEQETTCTRQLKEKKQVSNYIDLLYTYCYHQSSKHQDPPLLTDEKVFGY